MSDHFSAFSFVDRITAFEPGRRATGEFMVPNDVASFPACLVAEALGQLAAWVAMEHTGFCARPVAALAGDTRFLGSVAPGDTLSLTVELESCDDEAVAYTGFAEVGGKRVLELFDCFGAMLPVADFDAPEALAARFALLRGDGATPGRFRGVAAPQLVYGEGTPGKSVRATLAVPTAAPFFADHFPRRPVLPATLLLDAQIRVALTLARTVADAGGPLVPRRMTRVKVRSFTSPGGALELGAELATRAANGVTVALTAHAEGKAVATAQLELAPAEAR